MEPEDFVQALSSKFTALAPQLLDDEIEGLFALQVGRFRSWFQDAIDRGDETVVNDCFGLARSAQMEGNDRVVNSIGVSFVAHLNFVDGKVSRSWAYEALPPELKAVADSLGNAPT